MMKRQGRLSHEEKKSKLLNQMRDVRGRILAKVRKVPAKHADRVFLGTWNIKDVLAHLAGWDKTNLDAAKSILKGELPAFYAHHDRDWATYNTRLVKEYKRETLRSQISLVRETHDEFMRFLDTIPAPEFFQDRGIRIRGYKVMLGRILQVERDDEEQHLVEISDFVDSLSHA